MKKIELVKGIHSSIIGFGCAPILGSVGAATAKIAVNYALECGVTHFDLARSYGYGEAEQFVGKIINSRRNEIVIATKFGIKANWKAGLLRPAKPIIRYLKNKIKKDVAIKQSNVKNLAIADRFHYRIPVNPASMRQSLIESLKSLNTEYIDYFFVHEPVETLDAIEDVLLEAEKFKKEGKIRAFGMAFMLDKALLHDKYLKEFDVLQFNKPIVSNEYNALVNERHNDPNILFSVLRNEHDTNLSTQQKLIKLNADFPRSVILCSMFNKKHIQENTAIFD